MYTKEFFQNLSDIPMDHLVVELSICLSQHHIRQVALQCLATQVFPDAFLLVPLLFCFLDQPMPLRPVRTMAFDSLDGFTQFLIVEGRVGHLTLTYPIVADLYS